MPFALPAYQVSNFPFFPSALPNSSFYCFSFYTLIFVSFVRVLFTFLFYFFGTEHQITMAKMCKWWKKRREKTKCVCTKTIPVKSNNIYRHRKPIIDSLSIPYFANSCVQLLIGLHSYRHAKYIHKMKQLTVNLSYNRGW